MQTHLRNIFSTVRGQAPTVLTLTILGGLALWGHANDWKMPRFGKDAEATAEAKEKEEKEPKIRLVPDPNVPVSTDPEARSVHLMRIEFPSAEIVEKAGLATFPVKVQAMVEGVTANAVLAYDQHRYAQLAPRAQGMVWKVTRRAGDKVVRGEALALIEAADVARTKADFMQSLVQVELKKQSLERAKASQGVVPERQLREAEAAHREARVKLLHDSQALANLGLPVRLEEFTGLSDDQVAAKLRGLGLPEEFRQQVAAEGSTASLLPVLAPFDGEVIRLSAVCGEVVGPSQPLFVVAATDPVSVLADVRLESAGRLRVGQPLTFRPDAAGEEEPATGQLTWISPEADSKTRTVRARATLANPSGRLRPNTFGSAHITVREIPRALVVPREAVQQDGKISLVFVKLSDTVFQARHVETGLREGDLVEIRGGVQAEEKVVTTGSHALKSEMQRDRIAADE